MHKFGPAKEKEENWPFSTQCDLNILQRILVHCQPSPSCAIRGYVIMNVELSTFVCHIEHTTSKIFPTGPHTGQY